jgi:hypothetical protein
VLYLGGGKLDPGSRPDWTTGQGLSDSFLVEIEGRDLHASNYSDEGHDSRADTKGQEKGVLAGILRISAIAFYIPCGCHNLNVMSEKSAKRSSKSVAFFSTLNRKSTR